MPIGRIVAPRLRTYARIFVALTALAAAPGCSRGQSADHFNVRGAGRDNWAAAAEQLCGDGRAKIGAGTRLRQLNEQHIARDLNLIDRESAIPADSDHRTWRALDGESIEIFAPASVREEICEPRETPSPRPGERPLEDVPIAQPDAGVDIMGEDAGAEVITDEVDAGSPPPTPRPHRPRDPGPVVPPSTTPSTPTPPTTNQPVVPL